MSVPLPQRLILGAVLLSAALLAALPAVVSAQPPPPHLFAGQNADVTVDGSPWDGSLVEVVNASGVVVATVVRAGDSWTAFVPSTSGTVRFRLGTATSQAFVVSAGNLTQIALVLVEGGPGRTVTLVSGFNFIVWTGATMSVDDALAAVANSSRVTAIFSYDASRQAWDTNRPGGLAILQNFTELVSGQAYFFLVTGTVTWEMPVDGSFGGTETIAVGFTAIVWTGPDGTPQDVLDAIADAGDVVVMFRYNAQTQGYDSFRPGALAILQSIDAISQYDVLFIQASSSTSITQ